MTNRNENTDWTEYIAEVESREKQAQDEVKGVPMLLNIIGEWNTDEGITNSLGHHLVWGDIWEFITPFKFLRNLANILDPNGNCLVGYGASKLDRCLELGCDWGHRWSVLENCFNEVYGIEAVKSSADAGKRREKNIVHGLMENMPYDDEYFDVVISSHVLEHGLSPDIALAEVNRVTKPGGWSIHTLPCTLNGKVEAESITHKSTLNYIQWRQAFAKHGFTIIRDFFGWNFNQEDWTVIAKK